MGFYSREMNMTSERFSNFDRVRVDPAQTSFWEGREFRIAHEFSIAPGTSLTLEVVNTLDVVIFDMTFLLADGYIRASQVINGTPSGTFGTPVLIYSANSMTAPANRRKFNGVYFAPTSTIRIGGTITGGIKVDTLLARVSGASGQASSVGAASQAEIGLGPGTRHYLIENLGSGTAVGVYRARWEERVGEIA